MEVIVLIIIIGGICFYNKKMKTIELMLDDWYFNVKEMIPAVISEMKKQGKSCECIKFEGAFPEFMIEGEKYYMTYSVASSRYKPPMQRILLKRIKNT